MSMLRRVDPRQVARCTAAGLACFLHGAWAMSEPPVTNPLGGGDSVSLEPAPAPTPPRQHRAVFVCQEGGVPVFADRPCGSATATRSLVVGAPRSGAASSTTPPAPRASTRPRAIAARPAAVPNDAGDGKCAVLQRQLDGLNDRMRAGYSAREAARLWQRWRDTKERLRTSRC